MLISLSRWMGAAAALATLTSASAETLTIEALQSGGFTATSAENLPSFQNYFVGSASVAGGGGKVKTGERRSFFVFVLPDVPGTVTGATLTLQLVGKPFDPDPVGLSRGLGPGDFPDVCAPYPSVEVCKAAIEDPVEEFALGIATVPSEFVLDPSLSPAEVLAVWGALKSVPVADPVFFPKGEIYPDEAFLPISIPLAEPALTEIATHAGGGTVVLSGWMPSFTPDERVVPGGVFFEGSEAIFMFSDVHKEVFAPPTLEIVYLPVPEPRTWLLFSLGLVALLSGRWHRRRAGSCPEPLR